MGSWAWHRPTCCHASQKEQEPRRWGTIRSKLKLVAPALAGIFLSASRGTANRGRPSAPEGRQHCRLRYISSHGKGFRFWQTHCSHRSDRSGTLDPFETPQRSRHQDDLPDHRWLGNRGDRRLRRFRGFQPLTSCHSGHCGSPLAINNRVSRFSLQMAVEEGDVRRMAARKSCGISTAR